MWLLLFASVFSAIIIHSHCAIESDFVVLNSDAWFTSHLLCMPLCHSIHLNAFVLFRNVDSKYEFHTQIPWMVITNIHAHAHSHSHSLSIESDGLLTWTSKITEHILAIGIFVDNISFNLWWFYPHQSVDIGIFRDQNDIWMNPKNVPLRIPLCRNPEP